MTHLCDTCKYREEECKPRNARIVAGDVTECDGYEEEAGHVQTDADAGR